MSLPVHPHCQIDFSRISFPSDRLAVRDLRALAPERDRLENPGLIGHLQEHLDAMLYLERGFARLGFETASGISGGPAFAALVLGYEREGKDGPARELAEYYVQFKLANGLNEARELVHRVERAGTSQARRQASREM